MSLPKIANNQQDAPLKASAMSVFLVEDEAPACDQMIRFINETPRLHLAGFSHDGKEAHQMLRTNQYDLLILDVDLPGKSGIEILRALQKQGPMPATIMTTAFSDYAVDAFELGVSDYLLKPFSYSRFQKSIERVLYRAGRRRNEGVISIRVNGENQLIRLDEIIYLTSKGKRTLVYTTTKCFEVTKMLKDLIAMLPQGSYLRVHKQFVVNIDFIDRVQYYLSGRYTAFIKDERKTIIPVGAKFAPDLKRAIGLRDDR